MGNLKTTFTKLDLEEAEAVIAFSQPCLAVAPISGGLAIKGAYLVHQRPGAVSPDGPITSYDVNIILQDGFPASEPMVFETGGRIPRCAERHVNSDPGNCCITVWEHWLATADEHSLSAFLNGPVREYFLSQFIFESTGAWPFGERAHGLPGLKEAYLDALCLDDDAKLAPYLEHLCRSAPKGHWRCPCGSGRRLRHCHRDELAALRKNVSPSLARRMIARLNG